jgi:two-component system, LytTR family, sensor kinase
MNNRAPSTETKAWSAHAPERGPGRFAPIPLRELLLITALFWLYVTLSNVLYARSLQADVARVSDVVVFGPWGQRVLQHVLLFPVLLGCYWTSLRIGWMPAWRALAQLALGVTFASLSFWAMVLAIVLPGIVPMQPSESMGALWLASFTNFFLSYGFGLALVTGFALYQHFRNSELRVAALEREWSTARLAALRMQLSPHTLFNLLHTIRGQIDWNPQVAQSMMVQLADLLRRLLNAGERDFSLLADELRFAQLYLQLQERRFADRLTVVLPDIEAQPAVWVPSLILQPIVENAVVHGLAGHGGAITVRIETLLSSETLILRVINSIAPNHAVRRDGIGLSNVRERLAVQFGPNATVDIGPTDATTWVAQLTIPVLRELTPQQRSAREIS